MVSAIGYSFVKGMTNLKSVNLPDCVTSIESFAFNGCSGLTNITLPHNITVIEKYTFQNCTSLTSVEIPESVIAIDDSAFLGCTNLSNVSIGNNICEVGSSAFYNTALVNNQTGDIAYLDYIAIRWKRNGSANITIKDGTRVIACGLLYKNGSSGLGKITVTMPTSVTNIGDRVFVNQDYYNTGVKDQLNYLGTEQQWGEISDACQVIHKDYGNEENTYYGWEINYTGE